jgi:hypothetical protein
MQQKLIALQWVRSRRYILTDSKEVSIWQQSKNGEVKMSDDSIRNILNVLLTVHLKGLYMFRTLLSHPQEALHKRNLVYCVRIM